MTPDERVNTMPDMLTAYTERSQEVARLQEQCHTLSRMLVALAQALNRDPARLVVGEGAIESPHGLIPDNALSAADIRELLTNLQGAMREQQALYRQLVQAGFETSVQPPSGYRDRGSRPVVITGA